VRILLVQSPTGRPGTPIFPIGLAYLAGQLKGHRIQGLDLSLHRDFRGVMESVLREFQPDVTAISLRNIDDSQYPVTYSYLKPFGEALDVLEEWPGKVIVGGTGFSIYPEMILLLHSRIDYGIPGEAEVLLPQLLSHLESGTGIDGWDGGRLLPSGRADLESIDPPDYGFIDLEPYTKTESVGIQTRRGCAFRCTYCTYGFLSGREFRLRPLQKVMDDLLSLKRAGITRFSFVDSVFNAPFSYFHSLLDEMKSADLGLTWSAWVDESITKEELLSMKEAGAAAVDISPDAITDRGLRMLGKRGRAADLMPVVKAARALGMRVTVNFFNGNPGEGFPALLKKLWFMVRARATLGWGGTFVHLGTIRVYAHSPIADQMVQSGTVEQDCDFFQPVFYRRRGPSDWFYRFFQFLRRVKHGGR